MALPVLPLSSLASRAVLAHHLDTRDLPLHLHREMEDYRRLEGAFTIRDVHFEVARLGEGEVSQEEREEAWQYFLKRDVAKMMMEFEVVVGRPTENSWSVSWAGEHKNTTLHLKNPADFVHGNKRWEYNYMAQHYINVYSAQYLENGKVNLVKNIEEHRPKVGMSVINEETSSFKIDQSDCLTMVQRFQRPVRGLAYVATMRAPRAQSRGDREVFFNYEDRWTSTTLLRMALRIRPLNSL